MADGKPGAPRTKIRPKIRFTLSPKQAEAHNALEQFVMYGGAKGGGKSYWLCIWMFCQANKYKNSKLFFCRKRSVDFTNTTLETWKKCVPANTYKINEQKKKIKILATGSTIDYGGLDDPKMVQSLNSAEYVNVGIDQAEEIDFDSFAMIRGTLRHKPSNDLNPDYMVRLTANPSQCWLKDMFILNPQEGFRFIPALPTDNPFLPTGYIKNLEEAFKSRPQLLAAYLHGSWDDLASSNVCIQTSWVNKAIGKKTEYPGITRIVVNDPARFGDDENVIYVMERSRDLIYIVEEQILEQKSLMDTAGRLVSLRKKYDAKIIAVDSIGMGAGVVDCLNEMGEKVFSINSSCKPTAVTFEKKYYNLRTQMWMEAGDLFFAGNIAISDDHILRGQLSSTTFDFRSNGKIICESKEDIKARLGRSPDRADALVMGLYTLSRIEDDKEISGEDKQGNGQRVNDTDTMLVGDFSGYNLEQGG